uniref:Uncharacterized protein n=1 Tax=Anopheles maculatus TaxID=74869 RepID=A0A182TAK6_9DIPT
MDTPEDCSAGSSCTPTTISWEGTADIQSGDVLIVEIDDHHLIPSNYNKSSEGAHHTTTAVYQVTRLGHENCDITEGVLLDITPLVADGKKLVTLYDKDLTEGINLLIASGRSRKVTGFVPETQNLSVYFVGIRYLAMFRYSYFAWEAENKH